MDDAYETAHYAKLFGNCVIKWKIENFCLVACEKNHCIESAEFCVDGPEITKWRLTFTPKASHSSSAIFNLERLNDSGPSIVKAIWSLAIETTDQKCHYSEYEHEFKKLTNKSINVMNLSDILSALPPFDSDLLMIQCHLVVQHTDKTIKVGKRVSFALICLSGDLKLMLKSEEFKDIILELDNKELRVHKAMLCLNGYLDKCIKNSRDGKIVLPGLNFSAVSKYINYLYTGDLENILKHPSIKMYKCLHLMNDFLLNCFFTPEEYLLVTKIKVETVEHLWVIPNFTSRNESLKSPFFKMPNLDTTWQLQLLPFPEDDAQYLSACADIVRGQTPSNLCFEFGIEDSLGEVYYPCKVLSMGGQFDSNIKKFVKRDCLNNTSIVTDDTLNLTFRARTWEGEMMSTIGSHISFFVTEYKESSYEFLSRNLLKLFQTGAYSDISVRASNTLYTSHKCILSARSSVFSSMIKRLKKSTVLTLQNITPRTLRLLLEYIYSGVLPELNRGDLNMLKTAAQKYRIYTLIADCQDAVKTLQNSDYSDASTVTLDDEEIELQKQHCK